MDDNVTELGRWLSEEFPDIPGLFVYYHRLTRNIVIARWVNKIKGIMEELMCGPNAGAFANRVLELKEMLWQPYEPRELAKILEYEGYRDNLKATDESLEDSASRKPCKCQILVP